MIIKKNTLAFDNDHKEKTFWNDSVKDLALINFVIEVSVTYFSSVCDRAALNT